jgi:tetratricopeptide (TPR) repeat protein
MEDRDPAVHRTIVAVDVEGFGDPHRTNPNQVAVREGLYRAMREAFRLAGIPWTDRDHEDRGDGMFILVGPDVPKSLFVESLPSALIAALRSHNAAHTDSERIRLRMALHAGEVHYDEHGATAASINLTFRLLEAGPAKEALAGSPGVLAVIASSWFFEEVVRHSAADVAAYRSVPVTVKETSTIGWICLPDHKYWPGQMTPKRSSAQDAAAFDGAAAELVGRTRVVGAPVSYGLEAFKDRDAQLEQILRWLDDSSTRMITVFGRRGIGKSALAAKAVEVLARSNTGYAGVVNLSTRTDGALTIERIFFACSELASPSRRNELNILWASRRGPREKLIELFAALEGGRIVVVLDNIDDQLRDDGRPGTSDLEIFFDVIFRVAIAPRVLVTSQVPVMLDPAVLRMHARLEIKEGLPVAECVELLRELDRDGEAGLRDASTAELERAARKLHGVPRALELMVGALIGDDPTLPTVDDLLKSFTARGDIVDQLSQARYQRLGDAARITMDVLSVFGCPVTRGPVEWVMQSVAPDLDSALALRQLVHVHMVSVDRRSKEFGLHQLDAEIAYAAMPQDGPIGRRNIERRVAAWYRVNRFPPPWNSLAEVANYRREYDHLLRADEYDECSFVLDDISEFLIWYGSSHEVISMYRAIQDHLNDKVALLAHLVGYGHALDRCGPLEEAIQPLQKAIRLAEQVGDKRQLVRTLLSLGDVLRCLQHLREAVEVLRRAAGIARETDDNLHEAYALFQLSLALAYLREIPDALETADQVEHLASEENRALISALANDSRSAAYAAARRWSDAIGACVQATQGYQASNMHEMLGYVHNIHGIALLGQGRIDEAGSLLEQARMDGADIQSPRIQGLSLYNLAWAHWMKGQHNDAWHAARRAMEALRHSGGADLEAGKQLVDATAARLAGDTEVARLALADAANASHTNADVVPSEWLIAEAAQLAGNRIHGS